MNPNIAFRGLGNDGRILTVSRGRKTNSNARYKKTVHKIIETSTFFTRITRPDPETGVVTEKT